MSFDEKQQVDNDEIDLAQLFKSIWFYKFSLLVLIIFSLPISVMYSSYLEPTYKAETVFEKPSDNYTQDGSSLLNNIEGLEVENIQTSCCGMAGSFGYGKDTYEISMKMANERLFPTIENNSNEVIVIADGTSCRCQIKDGLNRKAIHLAKFLDENIIY